MEYYSQDGQDSILYQFFKIKEINNGFFLDVGSVDGIHFSNTYLLEKFGWSGICVEAHPSYYPFLLQNRNSKCYLSAAGNEDKESCEFNANYRGSLSSLDMSKENFFKEHYSEHYGDRNIKEINGIKNGIVEVPMRTIDSILEENNVTNIDLISIDIDGSEIYAFQGFDLSRWSPTILILEWSVVGSDFIDEYAKKSGYYKSITMGEDTIYCKNEEDVEILKNLSSIGTKINRPHPSEIYFNK